MIAVDPSDIACAMVRRISAQNSWDKGIRIIQAAVGEKSGELEMVSGGVASAGYFTLPTDQPSADRTTVRLLTIDQLTDEMGRVPDLIKIDVEGFELEVLRGASKTLRTGIPILCLELHNRLMLERGLKPAEILCDLRRNGYVHWTCGGQVIDETTILQAEIVRMVASNKILPA